jgi:hypothetical protein
VRNLRNGLRNACKPLKWTKGKEIPVAKLIKLSQLKGEKNADKRFFHFADCVFIWREGDRVVKCGDFLFELDSPTIQAAKRKIFELQKGEQLA